MNAVKKIKFFSCLLVLWCISGCAASQGKPQNLPAGRCEQNEDCPPGTKCSVETGWCEDIYFPRHQIKNY